MKKLLFAALMTLTMAAFATNGETEPVSTKVTAESSASASIGAAEQSNRAVQMPKETFFTVYKQ